MKGAHNCFHASAESFKKIPGSPIAYWVGEKMIKAFENKPISKYGFAGIGMRTGDNKRFLRIWHEVSMSNVLLGCRSKQEQIESGSRWIPYNKGGEFRKWYGNNDYLVDWFNDGFAIKTETLKNYPQLDWDHLGWKISNEPYYYLPGITWSGVTSGDFACRCYGAGFIFDSGANGFFPKEGEDIAYFAGLLNSCFANTILKVINPTINTGCGTLGMVPVIVSSDIKSLVEKNVADLIALSRTDWDEHETSWDFKAHPLVANGRGRTVEAAYHELAETWRARTQRMKDLEEENNRLFIDAYGLQDELSPDVPLNRISLTCNPWYRYGVKEEEGKPCGVDSSAALEARLRTDTVKELVSYAVGCLMGRYSLNEVASGEWLVAREVASDKWLVVRDGAKGVVREVNREVASGECLVARGVASDKWLVVRDGDATNHYPLTTSYSSTNHYPLATTHYPLATILPVMAGETVFSDNAPDRVKEFVKAAFGEAHLTDNLNFIEAALGTSLEAYLAKDFWNDHKRTYRNRPIYWLFRSKKGAFQALAYLHRMDAYTASKVRNGYLLPHIEFLRGRIAAESARGAELTAAERTRLKKMQQSLAECLEYDGRLHVVADRMQAIDLDDGVVVNYAKFGDVLARIK